jgi:hypothetical protein
MLLALHWCLLTACSTTRLRHSPAMCNIRRRHSRLSNPRCDVPGSPYAARSRRLAVSQLSNIP